MDDHVGIEDPDNPNASTVPSLVQPPQPVIESPPITREDHNASVTLMRSMMEEVRQLRLEVVAMRAQSTNTPNAPVVIPQNASTGSGENSSQGTTPILGRNSQFAPHLPMATQPMFYTLILIRLGIFPLLMHLTSPIGNSWWSLILWVRVHNFGGSSWMAIIQGIPTT